MEERMVTKIPAPPTRKPRAPLDLLEEVSVGVVVNADAALGAGAGVDEAGALINYICGNILSCRDPIHNK